MGIEVTHPGDIAQWFVSKNGKRCPESCEMLFIAGVFNESDVPLFCLPRLLEFVNEQSLIIDIPLDQESSGIVFFSKSYCLLN